MENARRKAYTARTFRMTTEEFVKRMETEPVRRQQTTLPHVIAIGGGVPIKVGHDVTAPGVDEPCQCRHRQTERSTPVRSSRSPIRQRQ